MVEIFIEKIRFVGFTQPNAGRFGTPPMLEKIRKS